jgi:hypothetical protein
MLVWNKSDQAIVTEEMMKQFESGFLNIGRLQVAISQKFDQ